MPRRLCIVIASTTALLAGTLSGFASPAAAASPTEATRISVTSAEGPIPDASQLPSISDDGNVVVFESFANSGVAGDSNTTLDVFVRNVAAGTTTVVSTTPTGRPGSANSN